MRCQFCEDISIAHLIELAETEFIAHCFPSNAYYQHQPSVSELSRSADNGCDLCHYILQGLLKAPTFWEDTSMELFIEYAEEVGLPTDIKIAINADHLYIGKDQAKQVELFDTLMVQAGDSSEDDEFNVPFLEFVIYTCNEKPQKLNSHQVGRLIVDPDLSSQANVNLALSWLQQCEAHKACPSSKPSKLPTRVIDVGLRNDHEDMKLYISSGVDDHYITLSHCWGGKITPLLTRETVEPWQKGMIFSDLPANFQHAISITQRLGFRYVWIDALCIIQDSAEDWEIESKMMGSIFHNALFTIAASTSQKSTEGFLRNLPPLPKKESMIEIKLSTEPISIANVKIAPRLPSNDDESLRELFISSPLHSRGWCMQETTISPRIIHYGSRQLYWQCRNGFKSADAVPPGNRSPEEQLYQNFNALIHPAKSHASNALNLAAARNEYYWLVHDYNSRKLTFSSDKLPAFAGIAELIKPAFSGTYIAGLWSDDLARGLLWHHECGSCKHVSPYRAPSWSWAVTDDLVAFKTDENNAPGVYDAQLLSHSLVPQGLSEYGQVNSAQLTIRGYTKRFVRSRQNIGIKFPEGNSGEVNFDELQVGEESGQNRCGVFETDLGDQTGGSYLLSIINGKGSEQKEWEIDETFYSEIEYIGLVVQATRYNCGDAEMGGGEGLVLEKIIGNTENTYARVGYLTLGASYPSEQIDSTEFEEWMKSWETETIILI